MSQYAPRNFFKKKGASGSSTRMPVEGSGWNGVEVAGRGAAWVPQTSPGGGALAQRPSPHPRRSPSYMALPSILPRNSIRRSALPTVSCRRRDIQRTQGIWAFRQRRTSSQRVTLGRMLPGHLCCRPNLSMRVGVQAVVGGCLEQAHIGVKPLLQDLHHSKR